MGLFDRIKKAFTGEDPIVEEQNKQEEQEEKLIERKEFDKLELLSMEKEVLNTYMSGHPLE